MVHLKSIANPLAVNLTKISCYEADFAKDFAKDSAKDFAKDFAMDFRCIIATPLVNLTENLKT